MIKLFFRLSASRTASAFCTVSHEAVGVISGVMSADIMAYELKRIYDRTSQHIAMARFSWIHQLRRWTHRLIGIVQAWVEPKHSETNFYITKFRTGYGCFKEYLDKYDHDDGVGCSFCGSSSENAEHIFFLMPELYKRVAECGKESGRPNNTRK